MRPRGSQEGGLSPSPAKEYDHEQRKRADQKNHFKLMDHVPLAAILNASALFAPMEAQTA